jgi:hypothetical protein
MYEIHQDFFMNVAFSRNIASFSEGNLQIYPQIWQIRHFEGVRFLPNSPTLAPRGSGFTPMIQFHENSRILVKNVTLGTSEWTRVLRKTRNGHTEAVS